MQSKWTEDLRKWTAELLGTFFLTFAGISAFVMTAQLGLKGSVAPEAMLGLLLVALGHGAALALAVYAFGPVSGAHVNPAISASLLVARKITPRDFAFYIAFQVVGAVLAAALCRGLYPEAVVTATRDGATLGVLTEQGNPQYNLAAAFLLEVILTFFLASAVASVVRGGSSMTPASGAVIGGTLFMCILVGGYWTGASLNPARTMGPAVAFGTGIWETVWLYWLAPLVGGVLGGLAHAWLRGDRLRGERKKDTPTA